MGERKEESEIESSYLEESITKLRKFLIKGNLSKRFPYFVYCVLIMFKSIFKLCLAIFITMGRYGHPLEGNGFLTCLYVTYLVL